MVRRKKSLLFSVSLASAGLVAGALFVAAPKSQATGEELNATTSDAKIQAISEETRIPQDIVEQSLRTHKLLLGISDENELKTNLDIVKYVKLAEGVYSVTFKDYDATSENYHYYNNHDKVEGVELNVPMEIKDFHNSSTPTIISGTTGIPEADKCIDVTEAERTHNNFVGIIDQCLAWGVDSMNSLDYARSIPASANQVTVAVVDTGIRANHEAFSYTSDGARDRLLMSSPYTHDYFDNDNNPDDSTNLNNTDSSGADTGVQVTHGTSVAGAVTESTPLNVKVIPIRVSNSMSMNMITILEAVSNLKGHVDVINLSLGTVTEVTKPFNSAYTQADKVFKEAKAAGTIVVAAAGNSGANYVSFPANSDYTIAVGSIDENNVISSFSQRGSEIDFTAPGDVLLLPAGDTYNIMSGTSFSAPFISAAIANILSEHPNYGFNEVYNTLKLNAVDLGTPGKDNLYGWGSVSFHVHKFADLAVNASIAETVAGTWSNEAATLDATASSTKYNITHYAVVKGTSTTNTPQSWTALSAPDKQVTLTQSLTENGTYTIWFKNSNNETAVKTVQVSSIDKTAPTVKEGFKVSEITDESATLSITVMDTASGLDKIVWHYKAQGAEEYTDVATENFNGETTAVEKSFALSGLEKDETYMAFATIYDKAGNQRDSAIATFKASEGSSDVVTAADKPVQPNQPSNPNKPKTVTTKSIKNPNTADINLAAISGVGVALSAVMFFILRAKRR